MDLNADQAEALRIVSAGHNLLITGQAGSGKSRLVLRILKDCHAKKRMSLLFVQATMYLPHPPRGLCCQSVSELQLTSRLFTEEDFM